MGTIEIINIAYWSVTGATGLDAASAKLPWVMFSSALADAIISLNKSWIGHFSRLSMYTMLPNKPFQYMTARKSPMVARTAFDNGRTILDNIIGYEAPSMRAESSRLCGIAAKKFFISITLKADKAGVKMSAHKVSRRPSARTK